MTLPVFITVIADHDKPQPSGCLLDDEQKFIAQLGDSVQRSMVQTEGGRWAASARQKSVEDLCALIRRYFKESEALLNKSNFC